MELAAELNPEVVPVYCDMERFHPDSKLPEELCETWLCSSMFESKSLSNTLALESMPLSESSLLDRVPPPVLVG
jgi:hypothetical protein